MTAERRGPALLVGIGVVLSTLSAIAAATSPFVHGSQAVLVAAISVFLPFAVAAELRARYPERVLALLLAGVGAAYFVRSLAAIDNDVTYASARALAQFGEVLLVWVMLAFPSGRLARPWSLTIVIVGMACVGLLWLPLIAVSPTIPGGGLLIACGSDCPSNGLLVAHSAGASHTLELLYRIVGIGALIGTAAVLAVRLRRSTRVMRRILAPTLFAAIFRTIAIAAYLAVGAPKFVLGLLLLSAWSVPLAIAIGLARGRAYDAAALESLVRGLRSRPDPDRLRTIVAEALDDETLEILYWLPEAKTYAGADGLPVAFAEAAPDRVVTRIAGDDGEPLAAFAHDPALLDHPGLLDAVSSTAELALETNQLETMLAAGRAGTITAVDAERRRIERDLHDGTQQRLIALRMKASVIERILGPDKRARELLEELRGDLDSALQEVRSVSHGIAPKILVARGLSEALSAVVDNTTLHVQMRTDRVARYEPRIETAVYFCCLEALQNVEKHAGDGAHAQIELSDDGSRLAFLVADNGAGFDPLEVSSGAGFRNIQERIEELGGTARIAGRPGSGVEVRGSIPLVA